MILIELCVSILMLLKSIQQLKNIIDTITAIVLLYFNVYVCYINVNLILSMRA